MSIENVDRAQEVEAGSSQVVTRSFDDKPTLATVVGRDGDRILVGNSDKTRVIGFLASDVYHYEHALFSALMRAFKNRDTEKLEQLWQKAKAF